MSNKSKLSIITNGIIKENPVLVLLIGTCPTLATSSSASNGLGMGLSTTAVLIAANVVISLLRKVIPDKVRIPCYIVVIAGFVTVVQFLLEAYVPALYKSLGLFIPLIVVNCIILGRAEAFANKNTVFDSALDGIGNGSWIHAHTYSNGYNQRATRSRNMVWYDSIRFMVHTNWIFQPRTWWFLRIRSSHRSTKCTH